MLSLSTVFSNVRSNVRSYATVFNYRVFGYTPSEKVERVLEDQGYDVRHVTPYAVSSRKYADDFRVPYVEKSELRKRKDAEHFIMDPRGIEVGKEGAISGSDGWVYPEESGSMRRTQWHALRQAVKQAYLPE